MCGCVCEIHREPWPMMEVMVHLPAHGKGSKGEAKSNQKINLSNGYVGNFVWDRSHFIRLWWICRRRGWTVGPHSYVYRRGWFWGVAKHSPRDATLCKVMAALFYWLMDCAVKRIRSESTRIYVEGEVGGREIYCRSVQGDARGVNIYSDKYSTVQRCSRNESAGEIE